MNGNPLISVIVPVYNAEPYLKRSVESLINQDCNNFEVILVNDGSNDRSGIICDEYASQFDNIIAIHQKNGGASIARKTGIEKARGIYVTFVDADDEIPMNSISLYINELKKSGGGGTT